MILAVIYEAPNTSLIVFGYFNLHHHFLTFLSIDYWKGHFILSFDFCTSCTKQVF